MDMILCEILTGLVHRAFLRGLIDRNFDAFRPTFSSDDGDRLNLCRAGVIGSTIILPLTKAMCMLGHGSGAVGPLGDSSAEGSAAVGN
jgi:hypothetical protein